MHDNYKSLVTGADATDTVVLSAHSSPAYRVMRTRFSESLEQEPSVVMGRTVGMDGVLKLYFEGDLDAGFAFGGQVAGRVAEVLPVRQIVHETVREFYEVVQAAGPIPPGRVMRSRSALFRLLAQEAEMESDDVGRRVPEPRRCEATLQFVRIDGSEHVIGMRRQRIGSRSSESCPTNMPPGRRTRCNWANSRS